MKLNKVNCFSKVLLSIILTFCFQSGVFSLEPKWPLKDDLLPAFNSLPEKIQNYLNDISTSFPKNDFKHTIKSLNTCLDSYPTYKLTIIRVTGYAGTDEDENLVVNVVTLKNFFRLCKSSLNDNFFHIGYTTAKKPTAPKILKDLFEYNPEEIRKWTIKEKVVKVRKMMPDPFRFINLDDFFTF